jgi:hypothetical protein
MNTDGYNSLPVDVLAHPFFNIDAVRQTTKVSYLLLDALFLRGEQLSRAQPELGID